MASNAPDGRAAPPAPPLGPSWRPPIAPYSISGLATAVTVLLVGCAVSSLGVGLLSLRRAGVVGDVLAGNPQTAAAIEAADFAVGAVVLADAALTLATAVVFISWSWRLMKNAQLLAPRGYSSAGIDRPSAPAAGWAIGSWFIPLANLVLPAYFLSRVDRISGPEGSGAQPLIVCWAVLFAIANVLARLLWRSTATDLPGIEISDRREIWPALLFVAAAVVAILMVRSITRRQALAFDLGRAG